MQLRVFCQRKQAITHYTEMLAVLTGSRRPLALRSNDMVAEPFGLFDRDERDFWVKRLTECLRTIR